LNIVGKTVEELGAKKRTRSKSKFEQQQKILLENIEEMTKSVNFLICSGHFDAWNYDYEQYKLATKHMKLYKKLEVIGHATAISLVFGGSKNSVEKFMKSEK